MSFLLGKTVENRNVSDQTAGAHDQLINYILGQGFGNLDPRIDWNAPEMQAFQKMFRDQNALAFGQAKESAGSLTGSGFGNYLGSAAGRASNEQGAFLSNFFENRRQNDANRFLQLVLGSMASPAAGVSRSYQPGFLDYAAQGVSAAAPFLAPGASTALRPSMSSGGQLGQAAFYQFPSSPTGIEGSRTGFYDFTGIRDRDSFGTAPSRPRYF